MTSTDFRALKQRAEAADDDARPIAEAQHNPMAFAALYDRYVQPIYRYLYYRLGDAQEAEALTSQTFLAALEALPRDRHEGHFAAWLFRIARSKVIDHVRRRPRQTPLSEAHPAEAADLLAQLARADEIARLAALIGTLDEEARELIRLRYTAGLPFAEVAAIVGSNENTVKKSLYRLLGRLQSQLEEQSHG